jgi:hypothetical protein
MYWSRKGTAVWARRLVTTPRLKEAMTISIWALPAILIKTRDR